MLRGSPAPRASGCGETRSLVPACHHWRSGAHAVQQVRSRAAGTTTRRAGLVENQTQEGYIAPGATRGDGRPERVHRSIYPGLARVSRRGSRYPRSKIGSQCPVALLNHRESRLLHASIPLHQKPTFSTSRPMRVKPPGDCAHSSWQAQSAPACFRQERASLITMVRRSTDGVNDQNCAAQRSGESCGEFPGCPPEPPTLVMGRFSMHRV